MASYVVQAGTSLQIMTNAGALTTLTLPTGVTIDSTKVGRFAVLAQRIVLVNSPTVNLWIDADGAVRPMVLRPPASQPVIAAGSSTGLTGEYRVKVSFVIKDPVTNALVSESELSPPSAAFTLINQDMVVNGVPVSSDTISARRLYRTTAGGNLYYQWLDLDGNTQTSISGADSDAALALLPASPVLGSPPGTIPGASLKLVTAWKDRLWAVQNLLSDVDTVYFSETLLPYAWPPSNALIARPKGQDATGVTAFIPRRDELGIAKWDRLHKVVGSTTQDFEIVTVIEGTGCVAPDSVVVIRDTGYFLAEDGVYQWGSSGVSNISRDKAHGWFTTDTYFNRSQFSNAVARWNPQYDLYELLLSAAGSTDLDRWVAYDLRRSVWLGPHKTTAFTPTWMGTLRDASDVTVPFMGSSNGFISVQDPSAKNDWSVSIPFSVTGKAHVGNTPDIEKLWLDLSVISKKQSTGTLTITPYVGDLSASAGDPISHDLTLGRQRLRRLGHGRFCKLKFDHNTAGEGCELYGYEVPFFELGRR